MLIFDFPVKSLPNLKKKEEENPPETVCDFGLIWSAQPPRTQGNTFVDVFDNKHKSLCAASDGGGGRKSPSEKALLR